RVADPPARPASPAWVRLVDLPCLVVPDAGVCVVEDLGGDCLAWSCPEDVELPAGARYQEPACAAFERAFELEPIRAVRTSEGSLDSDRLQPLVQAPRIGAYRILAVRPDPDGR
ncbi:MAG: hypothetical protein KC656_27055, partial [Myxococcales bacterium]|nr:hypothetical protein [Myxococcales bacterium]